MSNSSVRLALVSHPDDVAVRAEVVRRVHGGRVTVIADSMEMALRDDDEFDAAVVCSSVDARCAAESGKHVLVDAPVADSIEETQSILELVEKAGVFLEVGQLPRHAPANRTIMDRLSSGKLGDAGLLRIHRWSSKTKQSLALKIFGDIDQAVHLFDARPTEVYAIGRRNRSYVQIHLGFPEGGMAVLDFSERLPEGLNYDSLSLIGSAGAAYADDHHNTHLLFAGKNLTALISDSGNGQLHELQAFVDRVAQGDSPSIDSEAILAVHRVINAVGRSIESTQVVRERGGVYEPA
jgi:predicted dehydrogenase